MRFARQCGSPLEGQNQTERVPSGALTSGFCSEPGAAEDHGSYQFCVLCFVLGTLDRILRVRPRSALDFEEYELMAISRTPLALALGVAMQIMAASNTKAASITNLGNFGCPSDGSDAVGINASGQVAGGSRTVASGCNSNSAYLYSGGAAFSISERSAALTVKPMASMTPDRSQASFTRPIPGSGNRAFCTRTAS